MEDIVAICLLRGLNGDDLIKSRDGQVKNLPQVVVTIIRFTPNSHQGGIDV